MSCAFYEEFQPHLMILRVCEIHLTTLWVVCGPFASPQVKTNKSISKIKPPKDRNPKSTYCVGSLPEWAQRLCLLYKMVSVSLQNYSGWVHNLVSTERCLNNNLYKIVSNPL